jgi:cell wall-associated NlpC family hydrolase
MVLLTVLLSSHRATQPAYAQEAEARVGRFYDSTGWTAFRFGVTRPLGGIFRHQIHADLLRRTGGIGTVAGLGLDVTAFRRGEEGGYLVAGLSGGLGSERSNDFGEIWGSWSAGAGYDLFPVSFMSIGAEARWRRLSLGEREGIEVAIGLAVHGKKGPRNARAPRPQVSSARHRLTGAPVPLDSLPRPSRILQGINDSIVATATEAMGRPYTYGGTGEDGEGFDCSGLIQYSYGKHGIELPRRSTDQAREGRKIDRRLKLLSPADILTFSNHGGKVSHVGLYIGDGRFIHSATRGVQVSVLSPDDPYGRWWYKRWVGVRRIVE